MASHVATTDGGAPELKSGQDGHMATSVDKGLKMKIKRKSVNSGQRHEIVSEDDAAPKAKKSAKEDKAGQHRVNGTNGQANSTTMSTTATTAAAAAAAAAATAHQQGPQSQQQSQQQQHHHFHQASQQSTQQGQLQLLQQQQQQMTQNGPSISAPETVMRTRPTEPVSNRDQGTICSSVGIVTEPDSLGVCEPGTSVLLEGIVWQETEGGVLVVNVAWRGKTYVGTLLDATRHDWAPPRLTEESDERSRSLGFGGRAKRTGQTRSLSGSEDNSLSKLRNGKGRRAFTPVPASPGKCSSPVAADSPKVKKPMSEQQLAKDNNVGQNEKSNEDRNSLSSSSEGGNVKSSGNNANSSNNNSNNNNHNNGSTNNNNNNNNGAGGVSSSLSSSSSASSGRVTRVMAEDEDAIEEANMLKCPEPSCHKRFKQLNGLRYHQTHAHNDRTPPPPSQKEGGDDQAAVPSNTDQNDHTSNDAAGVDKSDVKNKRDDVSILKDKSKESGGRTSAACDRNTPNSALTADSNGSSNSNGASAEDNDTQNVASSADLDNDVPTGAPSPAYSDISDDNSGANPATNGSPTVATAATTTSTTTTPNTPAAASTTTSTTAATASTTSTATTASATATTTTASNASSPIGATATTTSAAAAAAATTAASATTTTNSISSDRMKATNGDLSRSLMGHSSLQPMPPLAQLSPLQQQQMQQQQLSSQQQQQLSLQQQQQLSLQQQQQQQQLSLQQQQHQLALQQHQQQQLCLQQQHQQQKLPSQQQQAQAQQQSQHLALQHAGGDLSNSQQINNGRPSSTGNVHTSTGLKLTPQTSSCSTTLAGMSTDDRKDLSCLGKMASSIVSSSPSPLNPLGVSLGLGSPVGMSLVGSHGQSVPMSAKNALSQPSLFPSFPPGLKLGQALPPPQLGMPPQLMAMPHGQSPQPSPRGKATPPSSQQERLTPKNSSSQPQSQPLTPNQFMPQLSGDSLSFSQSAHKRMSPSMDLRRDAGGPSPKPLGQGLPGPFGAPPPNMFLGGNPFGAPFQSPFGLEAMYHPSYLERFATTPGVPGSATAPGKATLDLLQQVSAFLMRGEAIERLECEMNAERR